MDFEKMFSSEAFTGTILPIVKSIVLALIVMWVGRIIISKVVKIISNQMEKSRTDDTLRPFLISMLSFGLQAVLYISVIGILGIETTSFAALLAAAGLAIGMALSGTLQNFAGGVIILLFKPFVKADLIEAQGYLGIVKEVSLFVTVLNTLDNKTIIIPNGPLSNGSLINYSTEALRRVDWTVSIAYGDDVVKAKEVLNSLMNADPKIVQSPAPFVAVEALADSSVNFTVRAWAKHEHYWDVFFAMNENVYTRFSKEGLNIPFPQMDVHVRNS
ncbi:MAG: mechanosensitive ion channel [Flavobacteriales bacterium]|tara:strand:- start:752 stop:1570 length:819 start_codon:yes stop_codon:yes gene_type:complete